MERGGRYRQDKISGVYLRVLRKKQANSTAMLESQGIEIMDCHYSFIKVTVVYMIGNIFFRLL